MDKSADCSPTNRHSPRGELQLSPHLLRSAWDRLDGQSGGFNSERFMGELDLDIWLLKRFNQRATCWEVCLQIFSRQPQVLARLCLNLTSPVGSSVLPVTEQEFCCPRYGQTPARQGAPAGVVDETPHCGEAPVGWESWLEVTCMGHPGHSECKLRAHLHSSIASTLLSPKYVLSTCSGPDVVASTE